MKLLLLLILLIPLNVFAQASMRRCTLLPVTDSVGGAIGFKVFEQIEQDLKKSNWCTYISNSGMISVFSRYRENLPQYLKQKEVLKTVAEKLQVGSIVRVSLVNEIKGVEIQLEVHGEDGEDLYFSEKALIDNDDIDVISQHVKNWLDTYSKTIPYDAKINGILGDQITLDVGKGYPIQVGQEFIVKRPTKKMKHPLLKKIVDWKTDVLAEGKVFNISDNQALGMVKVYKSDKKLIIGDWVRLETFRQEVIREDNQDAEIEEPGKLGVLSIALLGSSASVEIVRSGGTSRKMEGQLYGFDFRGEGWITRQYFAALQLAKSVGTLADETASFGKIKVTGGYKYLPTGFFYGPQIDIYGGYGNYSFDISYDEANGMGQGNITGVLLGVAANIPMNREFRFFAHADFMPFPSFTDSDKILGSATSASLLEIEAGVRFYYTPRMTLDGSLETVAGKAKFDSNFKEASYNDNVKLKLGASFNF